MATRQYIGARYVPKIMGEWNIALSYEPLSIVSHAGNSFTSKKPVPAQTDITNTEYWVVTGNYNAQVEQYRQETVGVKQLDFMGAMNVCEYGVVGDGVTDDTDAFTDAITMAKNTNKALFIPFNKTVYLTNDVSIAEVPDVYIMGTIKMENGKHIDVTADRGNVIPHQYYINNIIGTLRMAGIKNGDTTINYADKFVIFADGDDAKLNSTAYSRFNLGNIKEFTITSSGNSIGWINENVFIGGRIEKFLMEGNYSHNNNTFYKPFLEGCEMTFTNGSFNQFYGCRFEGSNNITFGDKTQGNYIEQSWGSWGATYTYSMPTVTDNGSNIFINIGQANGKVTSYRIDEFSNNYVVSDIYKINGGIHMSWNANTIAKTKKIDISKGGVGLKVNCKGDIGTRMIVSLYDVNGDKIINEPSAQCWSGGSLTWNSSIQGLVLSSTVKEYSYAFSSTNEFKPTGVKYIEIAIVSGGSGDDEYIDIEVLSNPNTDVSFVNFKTTNNTAPENGEWKVGDIVYNSAPTPNGNIGWVCVEAPNTWKAFGTISE